MLALRLESEALGSTCGPPVPAVRSRTHWHTQPGAGGPGDGRALQAAVRGLGTAPRPPGLARPRVPAAPLLEGTEPTAERADSTRAQLHLRTVLGQNRLSTAWCSLSSLFFTCCLGDDRNEQAPGRGGHTSPRIRPQQRASREGRTHTSWETTTGDSPQGGGDTHLPGDDPGRQRPGRGRHTPPGRRPQRIAPQEGGDRSPGAGEGQLR